jgi:phosphatidylserine/phosphatidylglycerophosphate/cardiolipin synthase-like enzyme
VVSEVLQLFSTAQSRIDICIDHTRPSLAIEIQGVKNSLLDARNRGVRIRFITEITKDNIFHCKELVTLGDEVRHLDRIKGSFYLNELEYLAPAVLHDKGKPASEIIYSNVKELVEHQQYIFDMLWNVSIAAEDKVSEIEGGIVSDYIETVIDTIEVQKIIVNLLKSARQEILVTFSTANAFRRQERIGSFEFLNEAARRGVRVRLLTPENAKTAGIKKPRSQ